MWPCRHVAHSDQNWYTPLLTSPLPSLWYRVVEPAEVIAGEGCGLRRLYVLLTRA